MASSSVERDVAAGTSKKLSTLERIQRLERVERERLERRERQQQAHDQKISVRADSAKVHGSRAERVEHALKWPMIVLGVIWFVVFAVAVSDSVSKDTEQVLVSFLFVIWAIVVIEYVVRLVLAPDRKQYVATRKIEPMTVVVPPLQCTRFWGIDHVSLRVEEVWLRTKAILLHRGLIRVLIADVILLLIGAWLVMLAEGGEPGSSSPKSYLDSVWWAVVTVTTVGYGDRFPSSNLGRVVAVVLMLVGIGLIGLLTATVASFFVREHTDEHQAQLQKAHEDLGGRLDDLDTRMARIEQLLTERSSE